GRQAVRLASATDRRPDQLERSQGDRADAERGDALSLALRSRPATARAPRPPAALLTAGVLVAALALIPLGFVVVATLTVGPTQAWDLLVRPRIGMLLTNTLKLVLGGVLLSSIIGIGAAWVVERTNVPFPRIWHVLLCAPLAVPSFVNGFGWVSLTHS